MRRKKSAIVPKAVLGVQLAAAVVPACALAACSGRDPLLDFGNQFTVACCFGVADATFGVAADAFRPPPADATPEAAVDATVDVTDDVVDE